MTVYILTPEGVTKDHVWSASEAQTLAFLGQRKQHLVVNASGQAFNSRSPFIYDERGI